MRVKLQYNDILVFKQQLKYDKSYSELHKHDQLNDDTNKHDNFKPYHKKTNL